MRIAFLMGSIFFISVTSYAAQSGLCDDLAKFTCSPGKQDDGTGAAEKRSMDDNAAATEFKSKLPFVEKKIRALIDNPDNAYLSKLGLGAMGLTDAPQCNSQDPAEIKKCKDDLTAGLVDLAKKKLTGASFSSQFSMTGALEEKTLVLENDQFATALNEIEQEIGGKIDYSEQEKLIKNDLFPRVKKQLVSKISSLPIDEKKKQFMIDKIKGISYGGNNCEEMGAGLNKMFVANAFYNSTKQKFKVCKGLLSKDVSEFHLSFVIAHELSHSIDPCSVAIGPVADAVKYSQTTDVEKMDGEYPVQGLIGCLRTSSSVGARVAPAAAGYFGGSGGGTVPSGGLPPGGMAGTMPLGPSGYTYCGGDQIGESVSDWLGAEVLTGLIEEKHPGLTKEQWQKGFSNVFRPLCAEEIENNPYSSYMSDPHPKTSDRINSIILVNPKVREKMGCEKPPANKVYCDATNPALLAQIKANAKPAEGMTTGGKSVTAYPGQYNPNPPPTNNRVKGAAQ